MIVKKATLEDINRIMLLFKKCTAALIKAGIDQWDGTYPTVSIFEKDIRKGNIFVIKENEILIATITLNNQQDEQYNAINWKYPAKKVLVIHRLAVSPEDQGKGLGKHLCKYAESYGVENDFDVIRLDAYSGNPVSCRLYEKLKYHRAGGYCWFHGNDLPFYCYEKKLI